MTARMDIRIQKIRNGLPTEIPSPRNKLITAYVFGYAGSYAVLRHKGCGPFLETRKFLIKHLERIEEQP